MKSPAKQVGGDYYDFLELGSSHVAFVLAGISGKGIAAALLMANLQANLRGRSEFALDDLPRPLKSVNQFFYKNTQEDRYATLFLAAHHDVSRQLTYANCGQNPPLVFRADGSVERLSTTDRTVSCTTQTITLLAKDVLVIYTDGVTEANDADGNEFGEVPARNSDEKFPVSTCGTGHRHSRWSAEIQCRRTVRRSDSGCGACPLVPFSRLS